MQNKTEKYKIYKTRLHFYDKIWQLLMPLLEKNVQSSLLKVHSGCIHALRVWCEKWFVSIINCEAFNFFDE